jgi:hypothetical protein
MKAQDLRIGNYVYNGFNEVVKISNIISQNNTSGYLLETLKPIALTEEILLKCGFEKGKCYFSLENFDIDLKGWFGFNNMVANANINHLHELQNLYYSLTKTELDYENTISKN